MTCLLIYNNAALCLDFSFCSLAIFHLQLSSPSALPHSRAPNSQLTMSSKAVPFFFAFLQIVSAVPANPHSDASTHHLQKRLATGSKIALGICVPCVAIVFFLGAWILWGYPKARRELREQNARREIELARKQRQGSEHGTLPVYRQHEGSEEDVAYGSTQAAVTAPAVSAATAQPGRGYEPSDARHAALTV